MTETYVAAKLYVDNWRWADTPFYVRAGKRLARRETTIAIQFKRAPHPPFEEIAGEGLRPNVLLVHVQPDEGVSLAIGAKVPGQGMSIRTVHMDFLYGGAFRTGLPGGLRAADPRLPARRRDALHARGRGGRAVALVDAIVAAWKRDRPELPELSSRYMGAEGRRRAPWQGRAQLEAALVAAAVGVVPRMARFAILERVAWGPKAADELLGRDGRSWRRH